MAPAAKTPADEQNKSAMDRAEKLSRCKALDKLRKGELHTISMENCQELFEVIDVSERGELSNEDLRVLKTLPDLNLQDEDIDNLIKDCDKDGTGKISPSELYTALHTGSLVFRSVLEELGQGPKIFSTQQCSRWELLDFLNKESDDMDALCSLPITLVAFFLFFILVQVHLEVTTAYQMQSAIQGEVEGEGKPFLGTYVHDVPSFYNWMSTSFVSAQFKSSTEKLNKYPYPGRFAAYNQIIGGTQVIKTQSSFPVECEQSLLLRTAYDQLNGGQCHKGGEFNTTSEFLLYHEQADETIKHIHYLDSLNWIDHNTRQLDFTNLYYNAHLGTFTDFHLTFDWLPEGSVKILFGMETWIADPYAQKWIYAIDAIYALIILNMLQQELKEMLPRLLNGLDGFIQYWEFWNAVDWLNIVFGAAFFGCWAQVCLQSAGPLQDAIAALPTRQLDDWIITNQTYFLKSQLEDIIPRDQYTAMIAEVHTISGEIAGSHENLRIVTFFYAFTLMLKFFKAFRANPRLNIVIMTIQDAAVDIIHFFLVFLTIFLVFSMMAYVMFGSKIREFSTQDRSFLYCWRVLLGEWDVGDMEAATYVYANIWFLGFQVLVGMILLNMLLAIIMDTYSGVVGKGGNKTIWDQTRESIGTMRETRGYLPLLYLICEMEDEDQRAHPGEHVTTKSLRKAFEGEKMSRANAEYLIKRTAGFLKDREEECELKMHDAVRLVGQTKSMVLKISEDTAHIHKMMKDQERAPIDARHDAIMAGLDPDDPHVIQQMQASKGASQYAQPIVTGTPHHQHMPSQRGAPINNMPGGMNNMSGMQPGMHQMPGMQQGMQGVQDPMAMQGMMPGMMPGMQGQQDPSFQQPFMPANHQNALAAGTLTSAPAALMDGHVTMGSGFGMTTPGIGNSSMMSNLSGNQHPGDLPGMANQQPVPMQNSAMQGGMGMSNAGSPQMLQRMDQMMMQMSQMQDMMTDQRNYIEQRDAWLETRMSQLDRRCQKVEVLSDRLYTMLRSFDINDLAAVPRDVTKALNMHFEKMEGGSSDVGSPSPGDALPALRDASNMSDSPMAPPSPPHEPSNAIEDNMDRQVTSVGNHHGHNSKEQMKNISDQLALLVSHAEATPQITRLLWRMDLNLRQLTGTASNLPTHQEANQETSAASSKSTPARRTDKKVVISNANSRAVSKGGPPGSSGGGGGQLT